MTYGVNLALVDQLLFGFTSAIAAFYMPKISKAIDDHFHFATDSAAAQRVALGVDALAQFTLNKLQGVAIEHQTIQVRSEAVADSMKNITASMGKAMARLNITPDQVSQRVAGAVIATMQTAPAVSVTNYVPALPVTQTQTKETPVA